MAFFRQAYDSQDQPDNYSSYQLSTHIKRYSAVRADARITLVGFPSNKATWANANLNNLEKTQQTMWTLSFLN
jgi:hypothetical protein